MTVSGSRQQHQQQQRRMLMLTAITALGSTRATASAFIPCIPLPYRQYHQHHASSAATVTSIATATPHYHVFASSSSSSSQSLGLGMGHNHDRLSSSSSLWSSRPFSSSQIRLFASKRDDDTTNSDSPFSALTGIVKKVAKAVLPSSWTQSEEERRQAIVRKERKHQVKSGITTMLKDAPLGIRVLGSMVAPLLSNMASTIQEAQEQTQDLLDTARDYILMDVDATTILGEPIQVQTPFSQSSSTISVNGKTSSQVQAQFQVLGTRQQGIVTMMAVDNRIQSLSLNVNGRTMNISLLSSAGGKRRTTVDVFGSSSSSSSSYAPKQQLGKNRINNDDIIDVEFVEKVERKP